MYDLVLINANVLTMDPARPVASLVAVKGDRIATVSGCDPMGPPHGPRDPWTPIIGIRGIRGHPLFTGDSGDLWTSITGIRGIHGIRGHPLSTEDSWTPIIDCEGRTLLPGFIDAHCHVLGYAESLVSLNLSPREGIRSIPDIQDRIRDFCRDLPAGTWVRGKSYNEFYLAEKRHPDRRDLDAAAPLHPVKLTHRSGHAHALNSLALQQAGITAETGDPPGGLIDRESSTGEPTGILYGMGEYLSAKTPLLEDAEIDGGIARANEKLLACGITSIQDASSTNGGERWKRCKSWKARGIFRPRLSMMTGMKEFLEHEPVLSDVADLQLRARGIKILLGRVSGALHPSQEELNEAVATIHAAGEQAVIHAIEEPEIEAACDAIAFALNRLPRPDHRHRIEHCSVCPPHLMRRIADLGITVVTQPSFLHFSGDRYLETVAEEQRVHLYAIGSMFRQGLRVGFSSDFPVSNPNPLIGIQAAVSRTTETGNIVLPEEQVSVSDALMAYTRGAAAANFEEEIKGSIAAGKLADMVLLNADPYAVSPDRIKGIGVAMTILGGRIVWADPD